MKSIKQLVLFSLLALCSCSESMSGENEEQISLIGQWKLEKVCYSDGASSCGEDKLQIVLFNEVFTFNEDMTMNLVTDNTTCRGTYTYDNKEMLDLNSKDGNCNFSNTTYRVFDLTANSVTINPPCREACIKTYVRI